MDKDIYGQTFRRARMDAARRLARPEYEEDRSAAAAAIGISDSFLKKIESGEKRPAFETLSAMAKAYNVLEGDLLPSMAPKGAQADRILGPLMAIPEPARSLFITQMESFARILSSQMGAASEVAAFTRAAVSAGSIVSSRSADESPAQYGITGVPNGNTESEIANGRPPSAASGRAADKHGASK